MGYRTRTIYTESQKALMWDRWKNGESPANRATVRPQSQRILADSGGIKPPQRTRSSQALSLAEREEISRSIVAGQSIRAIASKLERSPSTISRELARNGGPENYRSKQTKPLGIEHIVRNLVNS